MAELAVAPRGNGGGRCRSEARRGKDLLAIGSTELVHALIACDLVDELRLMIDPVILGGGKRFLRDDGVRRPLRLVASEVTSMGAILATYARGAIGRPARARRRAFARSARG